MKLDIDIATKKNGRAPISKCTGFQLRSLSGVGTLDFVAAKLRRMLAAERNPLQRLVLQRMLAEYIEELIVVGFHRGEPVSVSVTRAM